MVVVPDLECGGGQAEVLHVGLLVHNIYIINRVLELKFLKVRKVWTTSDNVTVGGFCEKAS